MAVATVEDVSVALGRPITSTAEIGQVNWWLDGLELIVGTRLGDISLLNQGVLRFVLTEAAVAKIRRGDSRVTSETVSSDDTSYTRRYESVSAEDITDQWWNLLDPNVGTGAYSVRPSFEPDDAWHAVTTPPVWGLERGWNLL